MSKLSIGKDILNFEQNIKDDAMRPTICILSIVLVFSLALLIWAPDKLIRYIALIVAVGTILFVLYLNNYYAHNDTDRLHTERFLINKRMIETGMIESRQGNISSNHTNNTLPPNSVIYLTSNADDIQEVEE